MLHQTLSTFPINHIQQPPECLLLRISCLALLAPETDQKALEFLKETLPRTNRVVMIVDPKNQGMMLRLKAVQNGAPKLSIELQSIPALSSNELVGALTIAAKEPPDAFFVLSPIYAAYRNEAHGPTRGGC
jgi:hypothetical protein